MFLSPFWFQTSFNHKHRFHVWHIFDKCYAYRTITITWYTLHIVATLKKQSPSWIFRNIDLKKYLCQIPWWQQEVNDSSMGLPRIWRPSWKSSRHLEFLSGQRSFFQNIDLKEYLCQIPCLQPEVNYSSMKMQLRAPLYNWARPTILMYAMNWQ